jgi:hypothetical protein
MSGIRTNQQEASNRAVKLVLKEKFVRDMAAAQSCDRCTNRGNSISCPNVGCEGGGAAVWCRSFTEGKGAV